MFIIQADYFILFYATPNKRLINFTWIMLFYEIERSILIRLPIHGPIPELFFFECPEPELGNIEKLTFQSCVTQFYYSNNIPVHMCSHRHIRVCQWLWCAVEVVQH